MPIRFASLLILVAFVTTGCVTLALADSDKGSRPPNRSVLAAGASRETVEQQFGKPTSSAPTIEGGRIDTYEYRIRRHPSDAYLTMLGIADVAYIGLGDLAFLPVELARRAWAGDRFSIHVRYGPDDRVVTTEPLEAITERRERRELK